MPSDPRCHPLIELDGATVAAMLAPVLRGAAVRGIVCVEGGLTNTLYRVTADDGTACALRVYAAGRAGFDLERRLLPRLVGALPVSDVLLADEGAADGHPWLAYRWIDGITLNECRRRFAAPALFRYPERYSAEFRAAFARGCRAAGGTLPRDWWRLARLLDTTRLVATLDEPRELPAVFAECRELVASVVQGWDCAPAGRA